jgi:hypothetical protein
LRCITGTALLDQLNHAIQVRVSAAKSPREPGSTSLGNSLAIGDHFKLTDLAKCGHGCNAETLLY